jgi:FlaA1/EpsC-like NDP-sugar epimerase
MSMREARDAPAEGPRVSRVAATTHEGQHRGSSARRYTIALLVVADMVAVTVSMALAGSGTWSGSSYAATILIVTAALGHYRSHITLRAFDEIPAAVQRTGTALVLVLAAITLLGSQPALIGMLVRQAPLSAVMLAGGRAMVYALLRELRLRGHLSERVVIVGAGRVGCELVSLLSEHREEGLVPVGFVDEPPDGKPVAPPPPPVLAPAADLGSLVDDAAIERVIVAFPRAPDEEWVGLLRTVAGNGVQVDVVPRFFDIGMDRKGGGVDEIWGIPLHPIRPASPTFLHRVGVPSGRSTSRPLRALVVLARLFPR